MNQMTNIGKKQSGFTLIEIAIVLVIIGLLLGGVLQGQQLIENSRVRAAANDFDGIPAAMFSYLDRYGRLPGDDGPTATLAARGAAWSGITAPVTATNGLLDAAAAGTFTGAAENGVLFQQLRASGFIPGDPTLTGAAALPTNPFGGLIGLTNAAVMPAGVTGLQGNKICMSNVPGSAAIALDTQLDDGVGTTGRFRATLGVAGAHTVPAAILAAPYTEDAVYTICYRI
ncbi:MAG: prepilin-type N-terminal cleavage/methylation domain-containing protein [Gammaproteobacteria bacterium]|uniref:prepilin-type N-terminal cleavage/methylation domain-containing protein n=1 Tax=Brevundimonas sp. TaxID=1871086 RepID=UPI002730B242|nr:prepilin-type N-terminal cleavage/methylation domain-containing protein [Brevundimonas sp.]MDP1912734.1 prepilin-type N-terminal cleavage/methylation domain-containing protein [Brevundimonas sp.]MDP2140424.1 prepilin-type N-terminal cleavage/methylation domain-containing protein [Gammaproteobacteria bacterium]MDP2349463.1 prepilin-type N-terminal cleavage/methylation domain-containing protein [Gammaproteobacteria bacterium]